MEGLVFKQWKAWCVAVQVSTECDAHLSYDTQKTIDKVPG